MDPYQGSMVPLLELKKGWIGDHEVVWKFDGHI